MGDGIVDVIVGVLAVGGAGLFVLAGVGVLRFPDLYSRMHAATKATALGVLLVAVAAMVGLDTGRGKLLLAAVFILLTAPGSAHFMGRAAYRAEGISIDIEGPDDLATLLGDDERRIGEPGDGAGDADDRSSDC